MNSITQSKYIEAIFLTHFRSVYENKNTRTHGFKTLFSAVEMHNDKCLRGYTGTFSFSPPIVLNCLFLIFCLFANKYLQSIVLMEFWCVDLFDYKEKKTGVFQQS